MVFSSSIFLFVFLPLVLALYYLLRPSRAAQNVLLLLASLFFYWWGEPRRLWLILVSVLINYCFGLWAGRARAGERGLRLCVALTAVCNLSLLFVFKYLGFAAAQLDLLGLSIPVPDITLPVGVSFFTFQGMSYVFDVAGGRADVQKNPLYVGLYIALFPQLVAGPIVRYQTVAEDILHRRERWEDFSAGVRRLILGLAKKVLLANQLAVVADAAFAAEAPSAALAWLGSICYTLQIYYDFSGYSDMAIGMGLMFGYHFLENFDHPYAAVSITDFWRRWHISLSTWFREYVYIPLGGNRRGRRRQIWNLLAVWALTGIWHGANWTFLCWGLMYFLLLLPEKLWRWGERWPRPLRRLYTLFWVNTGWVLFRADDLSHAARYLAAMFGWNGVYEPLSLFYLLENLAVLAFAVVLAGSLPGRVRALADRHAPLAVAGAVLQLCLLVLCASCLVKGSYNPFIYFNF